MVKRDDLKKSLKAAGKTSADMARSLNMNYDVLNSYLNGRRPIPYEVEFNITKQLIEWNV